MYKIDTIIFHAKKVPVFGITLLADLQVLLSELHKLMFAVLSNINSAYFKILLSIELINL